MTEEDEDLESLLEGLGADESLMDDVDPAMLSEEEEKEEVAAPRMTSPGWHDYVMSHFEESETDENGNPYVYGLRRVVRLLLGPILISSSRVVQPVGLTPGGSVTPVTCEHTLKILWCRDLGEDGNPQNPYEVVFGDASDVRFGNTDTDFLVHGTGTCATRVEARCLRKALQLLKVVAAEETTIFPVEESGIDGKITGTQKNLIEFLCGRLGIDIDKVMNKGRKGEDRFESLDDVPFDSAAKMVKYLSGEQRKKAVGEGH